VRRTTLGTTVLIPAHSLDRIWLVRSCVESITAGSLRPEQVLVVVDSNPALEKALVNELDSHVHILSSEGRGASAARNTGLRAAEGEIIACIDDDARADQRWLEEIVRTFEESPERVGVGGRILPWYETGDAALPEEVLWIAGCTYRGHPTQPQAISRPIGCNMAFKRDAVLRVGGFSTEFGPSGNKPKNHSNEELALALALRERFGQQCLWYAPDAIVHHYVPLSRLTWRYTWQRCWAEGISKADVRLIGGKTSLGYDAEYLKQILLPAIPGYLRGALRHRDSRLLRLALLCTAAATITGLGYVWRSGTSAVPLTLSLPRRA